MLCGVLVLLVLRHFSQVFLAASLLRPNWLRRNKRYRFGRLQHPAIDRSGLSRELGQWTPDTYDTFVNLGPGLRLFDYTLSMHSLDHNGLMFDNLDFSNFGYGGDPNDVSRLRVGKNKWYDFSLLFRRDKNFWDYNLLANPLNPSTSSPDRCHRNLAAFA